MTHKKKQHALFESRIIRRALIDSLDKAQSEKPVPKPGHVCGRGRKHPDYASFCSMPFLCRARESPWFILGISFWLWATVLFANFAESVAEGRGKAQADALAGLTEGYTGKKAVEARQGIQR